jgi:hypothetical protein
MPPELVIKIVPLNLAVERRATNSEPFCRLALIAAKVPHCSDNRALLCLLDREKSGGDWLGACFGAGEGELTRPRHPGSLWGAVCLWVGFRAKRPVRSL